MGRVDEGSGKRRRRRRRLLGLKRVSSVAAAVLQGRLALGARTLARAQSGTWSLLVRSQSIPCHWSQVALAKCQGERPTAIKHHLVTGSLFSSTGGNKIIKKK